MMKPTRLTFLGLSLALSALVLPELRAQTRAALPLPSDDELGPTPPHLDPLADALLAQWPLDEGTLWFAPEDSAGTGTVITLYNPTDTALTVVAEGIEPPAGVTSQFVVQVPAFDRWYLVSDVLLAMPGSWANHTVTNWGLHTRSAVLHVPNGVKVDGYVVFNASTSGAIDPNADVPVRPLRFTTPQLP